MKLKYIYADLLLYFINKYFGIYNRLSSNNLWLRSIAYILYKYKYHERVELNTDLKKALSFDHNTIWSVPRSGSHWTRFIAEYLTGYPTSGCIGNYLDNPIYLNTFPCENHPLAHVDPRAPFIFYKTHDAYYLSKRSTILLIIRDYHEYLANLGLGRAFADGVIYGGTFRYLELITTYHNFNGTKMLIYYEDLLTYPEREIYRIKCFLNASEERYRTFIKNYDYYFKLSLQGKNRDWRGHHSKGDFKFYQKSLSEREMRIRKNFFHSISAIKEYECVKPYISRYG